MSERRVATVLMLDVVGSTQIAADLGDARYRELASRFARIVRAALRRFGGREEDHAGDGFFATFAEPDRAIRCAAAIAGEVQTLGIEVRTGIHTGQTESLDGKTQGIAVVISARVMSSAGPGDILVTSTTKELVTGSGFGFEGGAPRELKGVPGTWQVFAVTTVDGSDRPAPLPAAEAAERRASLEVGVPRRSPRALASVVTAAALVAAIAIVAIVSGGDPPTVTRDGDGAPPPESVVQVDQDGEILTEVLAPVAQRGPASLRRGTPDHAMTIGQGGVWTLRSYRWLYHVDPKAGSLRERITLEVSASFSLSVAAGLDEIWVTDDRGLIEVDPATAEQRRVMNLSTDTPSSVDLAIGAGHVWVLTSNGRLYRFDPKTERAQQIRVGGTTDSIAFGHGSVWLGDAYAGTVTRIDLRTLRALAPIEVPSGVDSIVAGSDVWVLSRTAHALTRIDPGSGAVGPSLAIGDAPTSIAAGDGAIWVGDEDGVIRRVDEDTRQVTEIPFGAEIRTLAFDDETDTLWIDVAGPK